MTIPVCDLDFYGSDVLKDPATAYRSMLALGPVVQLSQNDLTAICGFDALTTSLRNYRVFQSGKGVSINEDVNKVLIGSTLHSDPPQHDKTRAITFSPLTPKALHNVRDRVNEEALAISSQMIDQGQFDAASELAPHIPLTVVRDLVGLGEHGSENMLAWGHATFELMGDSKDRREAAAANLKQMRQFLEDPAVFQQLKPGAWADRATTKGLEEGLEAKPARELMRDYIAPSLDTTISAIGYGIKLFAENPDEWTKIREDRSLIRNAIEEIVRLNTPIRAFSRYVADSVDVAGHQIREDCRVLMIFGAANRDAQRFPDPDRFDVKRNVRGHVGFGHGVHACLGMHLARLEMTCLFEAFAERVKAFHLTDSAQVATNATIHAYSSVPVEVELL